MARARWPVRLVIAAYLAVAALFCGELIVGVTRDLWMMRPPPHAAPAPLGSCIDDAAALRNELLDRLSGLPRAPEATDEVRTFQDWSVSYRARALAARARCSPPAGASSGQAEAVRQAFDTVVRLLDQSEVQAAHWARHVGPALDAAGAAVRRAQELR